jgi:glycerol-3-phosphate dehydrogenase (NAD(P)+)
LKVTSEVKKIAVIGGGSWATALVKILSENNVRINWWLRNKEDVEHIIKFQRNPSYLSDIKLDTNKVFPSTNLLDHIKDNDMILLCVPSAFLEAILVQIPKDLLKDKIVISAIKGMIPSSNQLITDFLAKSFGIPCENLCVIAGPCHSEEVAMEKRSYLTIAGYGDVNTNSVAQILSCRFLKSSTIKDLHGAEFCAVMKNIIAIASGIARGLNYGDNFQAVLVSNAMSEIKLFLDAADPRERDLNRSAYLGDLLVTTYSQFSRNRTFGVLVGRGYSVKSAQFEMKMVAEGYFGVKSIYEVSKQFNIDMPITKAVYNILYEKISPSIEMKILENILK